MSAHKSKTYKPQFKDKTSFKILLLGEPSVGKTSLRRSYMGEGFKSNYSMTIGADFAIKVLDDYRIQIWDLSGEHKLAKIRRGYYKGARGAILVFSIDRPETFHNVQKWVDEMNGFMDISIPIILVGNKADLRDKAHDAVDIDDAKQYAIKLKSESNFGVPYFESSALSGLNVEALFTKLIEEVGYLEASQIGS